MNRIVVYPFVLTLGACTGGVSFDSATAHKNSPDDPAQFGPEMFNESALAVLSPGDKAYVQGHALGIYLYGKTLPRRVAQKGYSYQPGISSPEARVAYDWDLVMAATSGGLDTYGGDDVNPDGNGGGDYPGGGDGGDGGGDGGGSDCGDDVCPGDGGDDGDDDDPMIDEDCEEFLDPAAMDARALAAAIDSDQVLDASSAKNAAVVDRFYRGLNEALFLEDLDEDTDNSEVEHLKDDVQDYGMCEHSPLVLDLDGNGVQVSAVKDGVLFDLRSRGDAVRTSWPIGDGLLALDWNRDGLINDGSELFGNSGGFDNGFESLQRLDRFELGGNGDGVINEQDTLYSRLVVWQDFDRDGVSTAMELTPMSALRIVDLPLSHGESNAIDDNRNRFAQTGVFHRRGPTGLIRAQVVDVWFRYRKP